MTPTATAHAPRPVQVAIPGLLRIGPEDTVVDVGCGSGSVCRYAGDSGAAVIGIDVEPSLVERADEAMARSRARSWRGIVSDCDPIPLSDGIASIVFCNEVLEHVDDPSRLVAELVRIGRPGALYHISVPDPASEALLGGVTPAWYWEPPFHRRVFRHDDLDTLIRGAGLIPERKEGGGSYQTVRWLLWWTLGREPYDLAEDAELMKAWERAWAVLMASPRSGSLMRALEETIPKSQTVLASKPGGAAWVRLRRLLAWRVLGSLKRRLRSGVLRMGRVDLSWSVDRHRVN